MPDRGSQCHPSPGTRELNPIFGAHTPDTIKGVSLSKTEVSSSRAEARRIAAKGGSGKGATFAKVMVTGVAVVAAAVTVVIGVNGRSGGEIANAGTVPAGGNIHGGIVLVTESTLAAATDQGIDIGQLGEVPAEQSAPAPLGLKKPAAGEKVQVMIYQDPNCSHCSDFESAYGDLITDWLKAGEIELEHRNIGFLDGGSPTNFSSRASNALACVANDAPGSYLQFSKAVYAHQSAGEMDNSQLTAMAKDNGADVADCIKDGAYRPFVKYSTQAAKVAQIEGTPSVFVGGQQWDGATDTDFALWARSIIKSNVAAPAK